MHELRDTLVIWICAVICGADSWVEMEAYGRAKEKWLRQFLALPHGIPSHDTFARVLAQLKAAWDDEYLIRSCLLKMRLP